MHNNVEADHQFPFYCLHMCFLLQIVSPVLVYKITLIVFIGNTLEVRRVMGCFYIHLMHAADVGRLRRLNSQTLPVTLLLCRFSILFIFISVCLLRHIRWSSHTS